MLPHSTRKFLLDSWQRIAKQQRADKKEAETKRQHQDGHGTTRSEPLTTENMWGWAKTNKNAMGRRKIQPAIGCTSLVISHGYGKSSCFFKVNMGESSMNRPRFPCFHGYVQLQDSILLYPFPPIWNTFQKSWCIIRGFTHVWPFRGVKSNGAEITIGQEELDRIKREELEKKDNAAQAADESTLAVKTLVVDDWGLCYPFYLVITIIQ